MEYRPASQLHNVFENQTANVEVEARPLAVGRSGQKVASNSARGSLTWGGCNARNWQKWYEGR